MVVEHHLNIGKLRRDSSGPAFAFLPQTEPHLSSWFLPPQWLRFTHLLLRNCIVCCSAQVAAARLNGAL
ncbi:hypothetical protein ECG_08731 [Echinococcus granulosus]|nr:hypothetical protein ECG_08731 [Echinococcus granulosus]